MNRPRGRTLLEVVAASAVFGFISLIMVAVMRTSRDGSLKSEAGSDSHRACMAAVSQLRRELRGARVTIPSVGNTHHLLRYRRPQVAADGTVVIGPTGLPTFGGVVTVSLEPDGRLLTNEATPKILGRLMEDGSVEYNRLSQDVLEIDISASQEATQSPTRRSSRRVVTRVALPNS